MKRTKRYGGFLVGDRVRVKGKQYEWLKDGEVKALTNGYCSVYFKENSEMLSEPVYYCFLPCELINLTRQNEEMKAKRIDWDMEEAFKKIFGKSSTEAIRDTLDLQAKYLRQDFVMPTIDWESVNIDSFQDCTIHFSPSDLTQNVEKL